MSDLLPSPKQEGQIVCSQCVHTANRSPAIKSPAIKAQIHGWYCPLEVERNNRKHCRKLLSFSSPRWTGAKPYVTLVGWLSWLQCHSINWKISGPIPSQGTYLGCGFDPWPGCIQKAIERCFSPCLPFSLSKSNAKLCSGEDNKKSYAMHTPDVQGKEEFALFLKCLRLTVINTLPR